MSMRSQIQKKPVSSSYSPPAQKATSWQRPFSDPVHDPKQDGTVQSKIAPGAGFNLMQMKLFPDAPTPVQAKLSVGAPGDKYEQEADSMANKVMTMPAPEKEEPIQREALPEEKKEEEVQTKPLAATITPLVQRDELPAQEPEEVQAKAAPEGSSQTSTNLESQLNGSKGGGSPLPDEVRAFMEPRFGTDFSGVRVHTGSEAVQMNKELGAQAFAHGSDIYYGGGKSPGKNELTAHELTHVVQQTGAVQTKQTSDQPTVQLKCSACEKEETEVQRSPNISPVSNPEIQRWSLFGDDEDKQEAEGEGGSSGGGILDWAKEKASGAVDTVTQAGGDAYDWAKEKGGEAVDTVTQAGSDAYDWAKEKGNAAVNTVTETGSGAYVNQIAGTPGAPDPCLDILKQIIELLNELARRINDALNDPHELFKYHRKISEAHPDYGSWDGHRDRYYYDRSRLRQKIAEWESNDDCRGYRLTQEQQDDLKEAEEYKDKEFPEKPAPAMFENKEEGLREKIANALKEAGIPPWAVAGLIVLIIAALADPEPFSKVALLIGTAAAIVVFIAIGRESDVPSA